MGAKASALTKLKITTTGALDPISVTELHATLKGTTDKQDVNLIQIYFGGSNESFTTAKHFGNLPRRPRQPLSKESKRLRKV